MTRSPVIVAVMVLAGALGGAAPTSALARRRPKPTPCPGGRYPVVGGPLVPGGPTPDAVIVVDQQVSVVSGCAELQARRRVTRKRTILVAHWKACGALAGGVNLVVRLAASCESAAVRFTNRRGKIHRRFSAPLEAPPDAFGSLTDPLPPGAMLVSPDDYRRFSQRSDFRSIGKQQIAADKAAEDATDAANLQKVMDFLQTNPALAPQYLGGVDPADPALAPADDGNYALTIMDGTGGTRQVITHGRRWFAATAAEALNKFPTRDNQLTLYRDYYAGLAAIDPALAGQYPSPDAASQLALADLRGQVDQLTSMVSMFLPLVPPPGGIPPPGYKSNCSLEEGAGDGTDRSGGAACSHTAHGVYMNTTWPLKFFATCPKDQGARGTCWDFAATGAVELWVAKKYGRWVNLSEQHMNFLMKHIWHPSVYGDGDWSGSAFFSMIDTGYLYPFESQWDYNPSFGRTTNDDTQTYTKSCINYGGDEKPFCSDTNHQGELICAQFLGATFCAAIGPTIASDSGFAPAVYNELWNSSSPSYSLGVIFWAVGIFQKPVVLGFAVPPSFYPEDANGYVAYHGPHCPVTTDSKGKPVCHTVSGCECDEGGHAVLVTGFIDNSQLPASAPPGSGGGYLIIKNSWGCFADGGYVYLPYDWVKAYGAGAVVLGDIN
ncbi:MAG TPA: C1 family peptidase [Candidatus Binatus sp.]|nr:C1 family peptidase [Candidatus Binatus sp.]